TNFTGIPISTGISGLGTGVATFLGTPSGANLASALTSALPETKGGTNQTTFTQGDILYASASNTLSKLAKSASATRYLANTGTTNNPAWDQINLANGVTGTLPAGNGGTGITSFGTGVATALGVNGGSAGAFPVIIAKGTSAMGTSAIASE